MKKAAILLRGQNQDSWKKSTALLLNYIRKRKSPFKINNHHDLFLLELMVFKINDFKDIYHDKMFRSTYSQKLMKCYHSKVRNVFNSMSQLNALIEMYTFVMSSIFNKERYPNVGEMFDGTGDKELLDYLRTVKDGLIEHDTNTGRTREDIGLFKYKLDKWISSDEKYFTLSLKTTWHLLILTKFLSFNNIHFVKKACFTNNIMHSQYNSFGEFYSASFKIFLVGVEARFYELVFVIFSFLNVYIPHPVKAMTPSFLEKLSTEKVTRDVFAVSLLEVILGNQDLQVCKMDNYALKDSF